MACLELQTNQYASIGGVQDKKKISWIQIQAYLDRIDLMYLNILNVKFDIWIYLGIFSMAK